MLKDLRTVSGTYLLKRIIINDVKIFSNIHYGDQICFDGRVEISNIFTDVMRV